MVLAVSQEHMASKSLVNYKLNEGDLVLVKSFNHTKDLCEALDNLDQDSKFTLTHRHANLLKTYVGKILEVVKASTTRQFQDPFYYLTDSQNKHITNLVALEADLEPLFTK